MAEKYISQNPTTVEALQLKADGDDHNFHEAAAWCGGLATIIYAGLGTDYIDRFLEVTDDRSVARVGDWIVKLPEGFVTMTNQEFEVEHQFVLSEIQGTAEAVEICSYCLSDPRFSPAANHDDRACPECNTQYSGPSRAREFDILKNSGIVRAL